MPLFVPGSAGVARQLMLSSADSYSDSNSLDVAFNFFSAFRDSINDRILVGGDNSFCGSVDNLLNPRVAEFAALPSTVVAGGDIDRIKPNAIDAGIIALVDRSGAKLTRSDDNGASWIDIGANLRAIAYQDFACWRGDRLIAMANNATNCDESFDNGATWPTAFSTQFSGTAGTSSHLISDIGLNVLMNLSNTAIQICKEDDPTNVLNWTDFDLSGAGGVTNGWRCAAMNDDGTKIVCIAISGAVYVSADAGDSFTRFSTVDWPLNTGAANVVGSPNFVSYWPAEDGFIIYVGTLTPNMGLFIPASGALDQVFTAFYLSQTGLPALLAFNNPAASDGDNVGFFSGSNQVARTIPASIT